MEKTEQKWLKEIRDNTKQLERIAKRLDAISRQLDRIDRKTEPQYHADVECNYKDCDNCGHKEYCPQRKTENSSEKPNNCEDLQDWKDRMWAEAIVTEPTTEDCSTVPTCSVNGRPYDCGNCEYHKCTADEPQTDYEKYLDKIRPHDPHKDWFETEPQTCEECEHWSDTEDGCADRHGCRTTTEDSSTVPTSSKMEQVDEPQTERSE